MNASQSAFVTRRSARLNSSTYTRCAGVSLSNEKLCAVVTDAVDPRRDGNPLVASLACEPGRFAEYAGRNGFIQKTCLMSVSISSWCCCSWCSPSSITGSAG